MRLVSFTYFRTNMPPSEKNVNKMILCEIEMTTIYKQMALNKHFER